MNQETDAIMLAWETSYRLWRANPDRQMHELPPKPPFYDLWAQGDNPLHLDICPVRPTSLVPEWWKPMGSIITLPEEHFQQLDLPSIS